MSIQRGNQFRKDRGERCAASRAFSGSSPTANLVSIIKGQRKSGESTPQSEGARRASAPRLIQENILIPTNVKRPRNVDWKRAAAILYGDWGTSKAYVIGLAFA